MSRLYVWLGVGVTFLGAPPAFGQMPPCNDLYGDPLPAGAVARMGSAHFHLAGGILATAFAPDGTTIMGVGHGKEGFAVRFWEIATGKETSRCEIAYGGWGRDLDSATLSPDAKAVAIRRRQSIELYDCRTGTFLRSFGGKHRSVSSAFSPDGTLFVAGRFEESEHNPIRVWEVATGKELDPFPGSGASLNALTFSADGKRLCAGPAHVQRPNNDGPHPAAICVWDVATRKKLREIAPGNANVAFAPSGAWVARENDGIEVVVIATGKTLCRIGERGSVFEFAFTPNGKALVTLDPNRLLQLRDAGTGKEVRRFAGYVGQYSRLGAISADGKFVALIDRDRQSDAMLRVWNVATGAEVLPAAGHEQAVTHLVFAPSGKRLASASPDGTARIWNVATGKEIHRLIGHHAAVVGIAFTPDGKTLASSSDDGTTRLWSVADGRQLVSFKNSPGNPLPRQGMGSTVKGGTLAFTSDGKVLIAVAGNGMAIAWDVPARKELRRRVFAESSGIPPVLLPSLNAVLTAHNGAWGGALAPPAGLHLWDLATGHRTRTIRHEEVRENNSYILCTAIAISADDGLLVSGQVLVTPNGFQPNEYYEPSLRIRERITGQEVLRIKDSVAQTLAFAPDCWLLAANDTGGPRKGMSGRGDWGGAHVGLYDPWTGERRGGFVGHTGSVHSVAFAPDGKTLASGSADRTILIWKVPPFKQLAAGNATAPQLQAWWKELAGADAVAAHQAGARLAANAGPAVQLVRAHLKPAVAPGPKTVVALIADLDSLEFPVRERAMVALEAIGDLAEPALRQAFAMPPSLEVRRHIEALLARSAALSPERVRDLRALTLLERIGNAEARETLTALAQGATGSCITREAQAALRRLGKQ